MLCIEHTYHNPLKNVFLGYLLQYRAPWTDLRRGWGSFLLWFYLYVLSALYHVLNLVSYCVMSCHMYHAIASYYVQFVREITRDVLYIYNIYISICLPPPRETVT